MQTAHGRILWKSLFLAGFAVTIVSCLHGSSDSNGLASSVRQQSESHKPSDPKVLALVLGASENDDWTAGLLATLSAEFNLDLLSKPSNSKPGVEAFGPHTVVLEGLETVLWLAICDMSSVVDLDLQRQLGSSAEEWIESVGADAVWLDGDMLQLHCGSSLPARLPIVFTGVEVRSDAYYDDARQVCGVMRVHSLTQTVAELLARKANTKVVAVLSDDSPLGIARRKELKQNAVATPMGIEFVEMTPFARWSKLAEQLGSLEDRVDAVLIVAAGTKGGSLAAAAQGPPLDLFANVSRPVFVYGPSRIDNCGVLSLRIRPATSARLALELCHKVLSGESASALGVQIPDQMELYESQR